MSSAITIRQVASAITIRQVVNYTDADIEAATEIFKEAFAQDPLHKIGSGNDPAALAAFVRAEATGALIGGEVYFAEIDGKVVGAACWFPPGKALFDSEEQQLKAAAPFMSKLTPEVQQWWGTYFLPEFSKSADAAFTPGYKLASYHLQTIATLPSYQGKGVARKLIEHVRDKTLPQGIPLCLEAITEVNSKVYGKIGFKLLGTANFKGPQSVGGEFTFWMMNMEPEKKA